MLPFRKSTLNVFPSVPIEPARLWRLPYWNIIAPQGHSSPAITSKIYTHLLDPDKISRRAYPALQQDGSGGVSFSLICKCTIYRYQKATKFTFPQNTL